MKKLITIFLLFIFPITVFAGGSNDDTIPASNSMSTHNCYYAGKENNVEYRILMTLYGVDATAFTPTVALEYYTNDSSGNIQTLFSVDNFDGQDYIYNYNRDYGTYFSLDAHVSNVWYDNADNETKLNEAINNGSFCPSSIYKVYDKTNNEYMFMLCNGYNSELEQQTCSNVYNYINNNKEDFAKDISNMTITKYDYTTNISFTNSGQNDFSETNIKDVYVEITENGDKIDDDLILEHAEQTIINQAEDQGITAQELYDYKEVQFTPIKPSELNCETLLGSTSCSSGKNCDPAFYLQISFTVLKYVAIILLIIMSTFDFLGATASSDDGTMKKAIDKCIIRLILCVILFVLPTILEYIFTWMKVYTPSVCGIK